MKKIIIIVNLLVIPYLIWSQEIVLTFNPADAESIIDSIKAININSGESFTVVGTHSLTLSNTSTGISTINKGTEKLSFYPNPFNGKANLNYISLEEDNVNILLMNSSGQILAKWNKDINPGVNRYEISVKSTGIYIISVVNGEGASSLKTIS